MRSMFRSWNGARLYMLAALLASVCGCDRWGGDSEPSAEQGSARRGQPQKAEDPLADMVSAVSGSRTSAPVELKFALAHRPVVGQPVEVRIAVLPVSVLDRLTASFQAGAGLELRSGEHMAPIEKPEPGVPVPHRLTIVAQRDGIFFVSAVVLADSPEQSLARTFSIPIIAGPEPREVQGGSASPREAPQTR